MSRYTKKARDTYIFERTIKESEKYMDKTIEETKQIYKSLLQDMEYANRDWAGYFWDTKILCYVLNYKMIGYDKEKLKSMIYSFEDDPLP